MAEGFQQATAFERLDEGRYAAAVHDGWDIGGHANGGYVLAIAGRAMADAAGRAPLTITAHYLAPAPAGPCEIAVDPVRAGGRLSTYTGTVVQGDRELIRLLGTFGAPRRDGGRYIDGAPPELPPYEQCQPHGDPNQPPFPNIATRLGVRLRPGDVGIRAGRPTGRAEVAGWFAFAGEEPIDEIALLLVADAFPPAVFNTDLDVGWVPTVELTVHVRAVPAPGPLRCRFTSRFIADGLLDEDGEMWDSSGTLVGQSRQLALTPRA